MRRALSRKKNPPSSAEAVLGVLVMAGFGAAVAAGSSALAGATTQATPKTSDLAVMGAAIGTAWGGITEGLAAGRGEYMILGLALGGGIVFAFKQSQGQSAPPPGA